ncbi:MAG: sensor histidine kinase, partial [Nitrospirae bacterium]|nr:sensor histidine kinase [Nitrospirota bacterium]
TQAALLRAKRDEITGKYLYDFMPNQYCALSDEKVHRSEQILFRGDGAFIHLQIVSDMVLDDKEQPIAYIYCCMDVSEIKEQEKELINYSEQLEDMVRERTKELEESNRDLAVSLKEKEVLLKEVHHRVRNSLQIITSMVNISVSNVTDPAFLLVLKSSYSRLRAIALLHDSLYESPDMESVGVGDFINILAGELISLYGVPIPNLLVNTNIDTLSINIMMSCGLILNELISNSLRHAFEKTTKGNITISFNLEDNNIYKLTVSDNGRGMDVSRDLTGAYSGILLVKDLVKSKLKGSVEIDGTHGTNITVVFKEVVGKYHNVV